ncbi:sensor histidine kinase [Zhihengliuella halotolerans]|uniref:histidine kinase n=1 Tax=Zhihengliuella halotolerans TaxID=370736 RepID=A0A4Q8AFN5_9MICC|nr:sensor histidine kinase [Zhihengliuella halotolerans]RZU63130.1 signal transduction histidine kinase [Zhihengliuella halotolerans]
MDHSPARGTAESVRVSFAELAERRRGPVRRYLHRHPRIGDGLVVAAYLLSNAIALVMVADAHSLWPLAVILGIAVTLWFRRRAPFVVLSIIGVTTLAFMIVDPFHGVLSTGLWFALYTAATKYSSRRMLVLAVLMSGAQVLMMALWVVPHLQGTRHDPHAGLDVGEGTTALVVAAVILLAANLISTGIGSAVRSNRLHQAELANWGLRVSRLAQTEERTRIAREMHDVVAHSLSVMIALSDGAGVVMRRDPDRAQGVLRELSITGRSALRDMRRVIGVLRDGSQAPLAPQPASSSLTELLEGFRVAGLPLTYTHTGAPLPEDAGLRLTVYRIIQESLTNVLRYGREVRRVAVDCTVVDGEIALRITDDGRGATTRVSPVGSGQGLKGIAERVAIYDGEFVAGPGPSGGWVVDARLHVNGQNHSAGGGGTGPASPEPHGSGSIEAEMGEDGR